MCKAPPEIPRELAIDADRAMTLGEAPHAVLEDEHIDLPAVVTKRLSDEEEPLVEKETVSVCPSSNTLGDRSTQAPLADGGIGLVDPHDAAVVVDRHAFEEVIAMDIERAAEPREADEESFWLIDVLAFVTIHGDAPTGGRRSSWRRHGGDVSAELHRLPEEVSRFLRKKHVQLRVKRKARVLAQRSRRQTN
eukprot:scaffold2600_cov238-Pinguiococcus_pyrenoidosus.AAC.9